MVDLQGLLNIFKQRGAKPALDPRALKLATANSSTFNGSPLQRAFEDGRVSPEQMFAGFGDEDEPVNMNETGNMHGENPYGSRRAPSVLAFGDAGTPTVEFGAALPRGAREDLTLIDESDAQSPLDIEVANAERDYLDAASAPIKKHAPWKDGLLKAGQIFSNALQQTLNKENPQLVPVQGLGRQMHNQGVQRALEKLTPLQQQQSIAQNSRLRKAQIADALAKPGDRDAERQRKIEKDQNDYDLRKWTLDFKKEDRDRFYELEEVKRIAKEKNDQRTYDLAVRKQSEIERANGVKESFEVVKEAGRKERAEIMAGSRESVANINQAGANYRAQVKSADDARKTMQAIEAQGAKEGRSPSDIETAKQRFAQSLSPEVRKALGL